MSLSLRRWGIIVLTAGLLWLAVMPLTALAETTVTLKGHSLFNINIRAQPGVTSSVIGVLPGGEEVTAIGRTSGNNWIQIQRQDGTTGWAAAWLMVFSGDTTLLPVTTDVQPGLADGSGPFNLFSPYTVNIRAEPRIGAEVRGQIPFNTQATATGRNEASSWVLVQYGGIEGWVAAWLVTLNGDINGLPVPGSTAPVPQPTSAPQPPATPSPGSFTVLAPFRVNVRSAPSLSAPVIGVMPLNQLAAAIGRNAGNNWVQIDFGGTRGWVAAWVVVGSDDTLGLAVTSDTAEVAPASGAITGKPIYDTSVRAGPGLSYAVQATLPAGTSVPLLARTAESNWIKISYQGTEGWVAAWLIVATADYNNLPVQ
jgi:uncharacterized protein YgiM (DUF1202 family)